MASLESQSREERGHLPYEGNEGQACGKLREEAEVRGSTARGAREASWRRRPEFCLFKGMHR